MPGLQRLIVGRDGPSAPGTAGAVRLMVQAAGRKIGVIRRFGQGSAVFVCSTQSLLRLAYPLVSPPRCVWNPW